MRQAQNGSDPAESRGSGSRSAATPPDAELARAAQRGDKRAFVEIVARHQAMVCGVALGILGDFAASEDAAQDAFLTAWRRIHDLREPERLRAWLAQVARNSALGQLRRRRGHDVLDEEMALADSSPLPDETVASDEEAQLVRDSLAKLPETYRLPLILYYREGQSVRAVAEALELSEDAVKQRLARGREMLRERMSGLIETVLTRTIPSPIFTMMIAAAIGALAAPAIVAGGVFVASSAAAAGASASAAGPTTSSLLTAMSTSKGFLIAAVLVTAACIPVGYHVAVGRETLQANGPVQRMQAEAGRPAATNAAPPSFENSPLFAEWKRLHETYGTTGEAMPALYKAITDIKDSFRRRAFRAALIAEWVQVDPAGGLAFFTQKGRDAGQRREFFEEWLSRNAAAAVNALLTSPPGWEGMARDTLPEIARHVPGRVAEIVARLPKAESYWDTKVRDAFAIVAEGGLAAARSAAEGMTGANREQALAGVALAWGKSDLGSAIAWARGLPDGTDRDEVVRAALIGKAAVDPLSALDSVGIVPPGGKESYFATTTGARVLSEAAKADFDGTVDWIAAHPGRLSHEDMMGIAGAVTERLNADAAGFLNARAGDGSLKGLIPAISSAVLNDAGGQRAAIWDWLKTQPDGDTKKQLQGDVMNAWAWQDPISAMRLVADLPQTPDGDKQVKDLAMRLFNGGSMLQRYDSLAAQAPDRLRQPLVDFAFNMLHSDNMGDPQTWIGRLSQLPEDSRLHGVETIARAWAGQRPEDAATWAATLPAGEQRSMAAAAVTSAWAAKDAPGAAQWVATMAPGTERDASAGSLALAIADKYPRDAWQWALSIADAGERDRTAAQVVMRTAARDPDTARQWIDAGPFSNDDKTKMRAALSAKPAH